MTSRDDILDGAARRLREASHPSGDDRARTLAAVRRAESATSAPAAERAPLPGAAPRLERRSFVGGLALGLAAFGIGVGVGVGVGFGLGSSSDLGGVFGSGAAPSPVPASVQAAPAATPAPFLTGPKSRSPESPSSAPQTQPSQAPEREEPPPDPAPPPAARQQPVPRAKPRGRPIAALAERAPSPLALAEALQLLHRAERAIYSDNAAWAVSLLDTLDERAPRAMLHEQRIATRILAWCADGQVERAERLASQARQEAPASIYGAILEHPCAPNERTPSTRSTRP